MIVPSSLSETLGLLDPVLRILREYVEDRLKAELKELKPVAIVTRIKEETSVCQKLQTGKYSSLSELDDLVGAKVVVERRSLIQPAIQIVSTAFDFQFEQQRRVRPTEFEYRQPHLIVRPPLEYRERHPELGSLRVEIQFTTALQHALDTATHDFDFKGGSFEWQRFRIVAQLRGTLGLADSILDNVEASAALMDSGAPPVQDLVDGQATLDVLVNVFAEEVLPPDRRRMSMVVFAWLTAVGKKTEWLVEALGRNADLVEARSLSPVDAVLGVLLREVGAELVGNYDRNFAISSELETLCHQTNLVPGDRRVGTGVGSIKQQRSE